MTLCYIFWGHFDGWKDTLACARVRANCPIVVISDGAAPAGVKHIPISDFPYAIAMRSLIEANAGRWASFSLARWFVLREFATRHPEALPLFCADWDVLIFRDLNVAYAPFAQFDYTVSKHDGMESAAYGVNCIAPLQAFCITVERLNSEGLKNLNDMEAWSRTMRAGYWKVGDLFQIHNGSVFDHSMHCGEKDYEFVGPAKDVIFVDGYPHFKLKSGVLVAANSLHCWGTWKTRTGLARQLAGIPL